jgi:hypothetical protein
MTPSPHDPTLHTHSRRWRQTSRGSLQQVRQQHNSNSALAAAAADADASQRSCCRSRSRITAGILSGRRPEEGYCYRFTHKRGIATAAHTPSWTLSTHTALCVWCCSGSDSANSVARQGGWGTGCWLGPTKQQPVLYFPPQPGTLLARGLDQGLTQHIHAALSGVERTIQR